MAYATNSGTLQAMIDALATFALANGWTARTTAAHRYWSLIGYTRDTTNPTDVAIDFIRMSETPGGANDLAGGTASATNGTAADALTDNGTSWVGTGVTQARWTYDFGLGVTKDIKEVEIEFADTTRAWRTFELQFSDDGTNWTTLKSFMPNVVTAGLTFIGTWTNTDWPLSPDTYNYVDFNYDDTWTDTEWIIGGGSAPVDIIEFYMNVGRDLLAPLGRDAATIFMTTEDIEEWHFFNEPAVCNYLHVAFRTLRNGESFWHHLSCGVIDKKGMSHNGVAYCTTSEMTPFATEADGTQATAAGQHNVLSRSGYFMSSIDGSARSTVRYRFTEGANFPVANDGIWPARDSRNTGSRLAPTVLARSGVGIDVSQFEPSGADALCLGGVGWRAEAHPTTGFLTLGTLPFIIANSALSTADWCALGEYPGVRTVRLDNIAEGGEITVGADTWKCFPLLRKVSEATSFGASAVRNPQSGPAGIAYKKVV
jgi:hypothetical protein